MQLVHDGKAQVVVTLLGSGGALLTTTEGHRRIAAPTVKINSKVGAGGLHRRRNHTGFRSKKVRCGGGPLRRCRGRSGRHGRGERNCVARKTVIDTL